jgi:prolyl 4-hydroxylase
MVWLGDKCKGGGTRFPRLERPVEGEWCRFIECGDADGVGAGSDIGVEGEDDEVVEGGMGITFKPIKGNAVYWENMKEDGTGFEESWHAGLPVTEGEKIGLNIWSWYQEGYDPYAEQKAVV